MRYVANIVLFILIFSILFQNYLFYFGCHSSDCSISHSTLKDILIFNRALSYVLVFSYIKLVYGNIFHAFPIYNVLAISLISIGQFLNFMVYNKLGTNNVYYGIEYGVNDKKQEYLTEFPFNLGHPQYIGCIITLLGLFFLTGFNKNGTIRIRVIALTLFVSLTYIMSMIVESNCVTKTCEGNK